MSLTQTILKPFKGFLIKVGELFLREYRLLKIARKGVTLQQRIEDTYQIFKSTRIYLLFNLLGIVVFTVLPQGKDVILLAIEGLSNFNLIASLSLLLGLAGWSIASEFGARYKIYVTDNSGWHLSDERVIYRKEAQKVIAIFYLCLPFLIVFISVLIIGVNSVPAFELNYLWPYLLLLLLLLLCLGLLSNFYLSLDKKDNKSRNRSMFLIDAEELKWINRLYGIYNDHLFVLMRKENLKDEDKLPNDDARHLAQTYTRFIQELELIPHRSTDEAGFEKKTGIQETFPRDFVKEELLAPISFEEVHFKEKNESLNRQKETLEPSDTGYFKWVFKNNPSFYKTLHKQVFVFAIVSFLLILTISIDWFISYDIIGSPALVCLSFGCWLGIYTFLLFIDQRYKRKFPVSLRWLVFLWFFIVSYVDNDHPVRTVHFSGVQRLELKTHFDEWIKSRVPDSLLLDSAFASQLNKNNTCLQCDTTNAVRSNYPVFFITAEGGALRTGAFTGLLLAKIQELKPDFKNHIYAFSTVSGGTVGVGFFNAVTYLRNKPVPGLDSSFQQATKTFFTHDHLAPVLGKMLYGEELNYFLPWHVESFDRAIALEKSWEKGYCKAFNSTDETNVFSTDFLKAYDKIDAPAWFINTTEVETGMQCYISNVAPSGFLFNDQRDLLSKKINGGIRYSTAINFSSRFPLVSPSAALKQNDNQTFHYIDGGYVENTGSKTMLELINQLDSMVICRHLKPVLINIRFSDDQKFGKTGFLNEISSILVGIYNTRAGSSKTNDSLLKQKISKLNGEIIDIPLSATTSEVPLSWVFSQKSFHNLDSAITRILLHSKDSYKLQKILGISKEMIENSRTQINNP